MNPKLLGQTLDLLAKSLVEDKSLRGNAQPEDQLKRPVCQIIETIMPQTVTHTEVRVAEVMGRPDIGVAVSGTLCGYVELKAPGMGAQTSKFRGRDKEQWERFKAIPNLLYTDGFEWVLYRSGERCGNKVRLEIEKGHIDDKSASALYAILIDFMNWEPIVPQNSKALAKTLAPLCRLLREQVSDVLEDEDSAIRILCGTIREELFPDLTNERFADIYAQIITYALLLARLSGNNNLTAESAIATLNEGHSLLSTVLQHMAHREARSEVNEPVSILERVIGAVDPAGLGKRGDPWLYFYEDFLDAYDRKLRNNKGVYYTPVEVIRCQISLCARLLEERFQKNLAYADEDVVFLDPAAGTGAYPIAAIEYAIEKASREFGEGIAAAQANRCLQNINAFEILVGPYAVAHLRMTQMLKSYGATIPREGVHVYLTDTLDNPYADIPAPTIFGRNLTEEHRRASMVKRHSRVLVVMGNPPYDQERQDEESENKQRKGGWIRHGDSEAQEASIRNAPLEDFLRDAREHGFGEHTKTLYNDYVYFWRWALWKMFDNPDSSGPGIVSFITSSKYLRGPGFVGMRKKIREAFDDFWIIDLEGDNIGARKTENIFAIQTPVAIAIGVRNNAAKPQRPANVHYTKIIGTASEKLEFLNQINIFTELHWQECSNDWFAPLLPRIDGNYSEWPEITSLFPWQTCGIQWGRTWCYSHDKSNLETRLKTLLSEQDQKIKKGLFDESANRKYDRKYNNLAPVASLCNAEFPFAPHLVAIRSFDRQWAIKDDRFLDRLKTSLWDTVFVKQIFLGTLLSEPLGLGPSMSVSAYVPDLNYFCGRGGHIIPLYKDADGKEPNITSGLLEILSRELGIAVTAEDLAAYVYAIMSAPKYVETYSEELVIPSPRIPISKNPDMFSEAVTHGRHLICLHTFGERFLPQGARGGQLPQGAARCVKGKDIPNSEEEYPVDFRYDDNRQTLIVGSGEIAPVSREVYEFSISDFKVLQSWLSYRKKDGAGRQSSPLNDIRPAKWTMEMTTELLKLIWILEATVALQSELNALLHRITAQQCFKSNEFPTPTAKERKEPNKKKKESKKSLEKANAEKKKGQGRLF